ncbi:hypothetical protein RN02_12525 [Pseudomonas sp. PI1]|nr:hypothetical protein RN02_12525 [Pseudomonas sp. PI1]
MFNFYEATLCKFSSMRLRCGVAIGHGIANIRLDRSARKCQLYNLFEGDLLARYGFVTGVHNNDVPFNRPNGSNEMLYTRLSEVDAIAWLDYLIGATTDLKEYCVVGVDARQGVKGLPCDYGHSPEQLATIECELVVTVSTEGNEAFGALAAQIERFIEGHIFEIAGSQNGVKAQIRAVVQTCG